MINEWVQGSWSAVMPQLRVGYQGWEEGRKIGS
jgi:hypothetical protein